MTILFTDTSPVMVLPTWMGAANADHPPSVRVSRLAHQQALAHVGGEWLEQGGLLLGRAWAHPNQPQQVAHIEILHAVPSPSSVSSSYSLRMGASIWAQAQQQLASLNAHLAPTESKLRILGWFHSHPHLGAFFSSTDIKTQQAFFSQAYCVGWVIDPFTEDPERHQAFFIGPQCVQVGAVVEEA